MRQDDCEFKATLGYIARAGLQKKGSRAVGFNSMYCRKVVRF
jgi:hypothetical protein